MLVTLIATFGVSAILVGVMAALSMIERRLVPGGRRAPAAADSSWPLGPTARRRADAPHWADAADHCRGGANPQLTNRSINGH